MVEHGYNLYLDNFAKEGFSEIVADVQPGDLILMNLGSKVPNHAAIYLGDQLVLHHVQLSFSRDVYGGYYGALSTAYAMKVVKVYGAR